VRKGARDYLLKPVDPQQILARVEEVLAETRRPRRRREIVNELDSLVSELKDTTFQKSNHSGAPQNIGEVASAIDPARYLQCGSLSLDLHARHATLGTQFIPLAPTTFDYLVTLVRHSPVVVTYENLVLESQGYELSAVEAQEMVRWRIHELRKAIEPDPRQPQHIITVRRIGYRLVV
jgi:DNA-binding response OmpR family regulator